METPVLMPRFGAAHPLNLKRVSVATLVTKFQRLQSGELG